MNAELVTRIAEALLILSAVIPIPMVVCAEKGMRGKGDACAEKGTRKRGDAEKGTEKRGKGDAQSAEKGTHTF